MIIVAYVGKSSNRLAARKIFLLLFNAVGECIESRFSNIGECWFFCIAETSFLDQSQGFENVSDIVEPSYLVL